MSEAMARGDAETRRCSRTGCTAAATTGIKICVPAQGWPIDMHQPISACFGVAVCDPHFAELKVEEWLSKEFRKIIEITAGGRAPPDFERAFITRAALTSPEWLAATKSGPTLRVSAPPRDKNA